MGEDHESQLGIERHGVSRRWRTVHYVFPVMRPGVKKMISGDIGKTRQEAR